MEMEVGAKVRAVVEVTDLDGITPLCKPGSIGVVKHVEADGRTCLVDFGGPELTQMELWDDCVPAMLC